MSKIDRFDGHRFFVSSMENGDQEVCAVANRVDLDAMIPRADFAEVAGDSRQERLPSLRLSELTAAAPLTKTIRKPEFQRETNHWSPRQVTDLVKSFVDDELVPSIIMWDSSSYSFVIDGGHRISALRAWIEDDYGDGAISKAFFAGNISKEQLKIADRTRRMIRDEVGKFSDLSSIVGKTNYPDEKMIRRANLMFKRSLPLLWVTGNKKVAETSFFKINSQGTALDEVETSLIVNRERPVAIAARAIMRSGSGHKYWAEFEESNQLEITEMAGRLFKTLFEPEIESPVRTLDIPLGGSTSPVNALALLIDFLLIAGRACIERKPIEEYPKDLTGEATLAIMKRALTVFQRMTTTHPGSCGLHPAVYYYSAQGKHNRFLLLGITEVFTRAVLNNDSNFFFKFTSARKEVETFFKEHKSLITFLLQNLHAKKRVDSVAILFSSLIARVNDDRSIAPVDVLSEIGISGTVYNLKFATATKDFSEEAKSASFVRRALDAAIACPECQGLLDPVRSISYDHIVRARDGGLGGEDNCAMTHPFCNSAVKN